MTSNLVGSSESSQTHAFLVNKSTIPVKLSSIPIGRTITSGFAPSISSICLTTRKKSAPTRSNLLTNMILATPESLAYLQFVSDCGSTPPDPQNTPTPPSRTFRERYTSIVKSTWPGVSIIFSL